MYQKVDEIELQKIIKEFKNTEYVNFGFTPEKLVITLRDNQVIIYLSEYSDVIAIYSRYLSKESLYENDDISLKHIHVFSNVNPDNLTKEVVVKQEGNVIVDYTITSYLKVFKDAENKVVKDLKAKIEEDIRKINELLPEDKVAYFENSFTIYEVGEGEDFKKNTFYEWENNDDTINECIELKKGLIYCNYHPTYIVLLKEEYEKFYKIRLENGINCSIMVNSNELVRTNYFYYKDILSYYKEEYVVPYYGFSYCYSRTGETLNFTLAGNGWKYILKDQINEKTFKEMLWRKKYKESLTEEELEKIFVRMYIDGSKGFYLDFYYKDDSNFLYMYNSKYKVTIFELPYLNVIFQT